MKRSIFLTAAVAAFASVGLAAPASAAPSEKACFGQVHKTVNSGAVAPFQNVGDLVKAAGGQGKNATARGLC